MLWEGGENLGEKLYELETIIIIQHDGQAASHPLRSVKPLPGRPIQLAMYTSATLTPTPKTCPPVQR